MGIVRLLTEPVGRLERHFPPLLSTMHGPLPTDPRARRFHKRDSSVELIRVVAMSIIFIGHMFDHSWPLDSIPDGTYQAWLGCTRGLTDLYVVAAGFLMLSFSWSGALKLVLLVMVFSWLNLLLLVISGHGSALNGADWLKYIVWPISRGNYWFIRVYVALMFVAPLINAALRNLTLTSLRMVTLWVNVGLLLFGWIGGNESADPFSLWSFIACYLLGYWLAREPLLERVPTAMLAAVILGSMAVGVIGTLSDWHEPEEPHTLFGMRQYNSLYALTWTVALCALILRFPFHSRFINTLGVASLGCYLLHDGEFGVRFFYLWQHDFVAIHGWHSPATWLMLTGSFIGVWAAAVVVTGMLRSVIGRVSHTLASHIPSSLRNDVN